MSKGYGGIETVTFDMGVEFTEYTEVMKHLTGVWNLWWSEQHMFCSCLLASYMF
jgi:hypothetical protein